MQGDMQTLPATSVQAVTDAAISAVWLDRFLDYADVSKASQNVYKRNLRQLFRYFYENGIRQPQRRDILQYRQHLQEKGLRATSIHAYMNAARLFFQWTAEEGLYPNVADKVKSVKVTTEHRRGYLSKENAKELLAGTAGKSEKDMRDYAILVLMMSCGLRTVEVVRADVGDIRQQGADVFLMVEGKGYQGNKTAVKVPQQVVTHITAYLRQRKAKQNEPLFSSISNQNAGSRMTTRAVSAIVKDRLKAVGIDSPFLTAHSLRHTAVTYAFLSGMDIRQVKDFARHSKIETTEIYDHSLEKQKNPCADRVAQMLFS